MTEQLGLVLPREEVERLLNEGAELLYRARLASTGLTRLREQLLAAIEESPPAGGCHPGLYPRVLARPAEDGGPVNYREPTRWEEFRWRWAEFWQRILGAWDVLRGRAVAAYAVEWPGPSRN